MNRALIIFIKNPEKGKVKTRLAATIGDERALEVYRELLVHTRRVAANVEADCLLFYSNYVVPDDDWDGKRFKKFVQTGTDLGERMRGAFELAFARYGYGQVVIIGSDCAELTSDTITTAFNKLEHCDVVLGPSADGGYYLLGMNDMFPDVFENKHWSTSSVLEDTQVDIKNAGLTYSLLAVLTDIDTEADLTNSTWSN